MHKILQVGLSVTALLSVVGVGVEKRYVDILDYGRRPIATLDIKHCTVRVKDSFLERLDRKQFSNKWLDSQDILNMVYEVETFDGEPVTLFWRKMNHSYLSDVFKDCK